MSLTKELSVAAVVGLVTVSIGPDFAQAKSHKVCLNEVKSIKEGISKAESYAKCRGNRGKAVLREMLNMCAKANSKGFGNIFVSEKAARKICAANFKSPGLNDPN